MAKLSNASVLFLGFLVSCSLGQEDEGDMGDGEDMMEDALTSDQMKGLHAKFDANGDGKASMEELLTFSQGVRTAMATKDIGMILEEMDLNKDGQLNLEELLKDMETQAEGDEEEMKEIASRRELETQKFQASDKNGDGQLDVNELPALFYPETHPGVLALTAAATLKQKDGNGDGKLTLREFWEGDLVEGEEGGSSISDEEKADFAKLDKNGDGQLDLKELEVWESGRFHTEEALRQLFDHADQDKDGHVTAAELEQAREKIAGSDAQYHLMEWAEHHEL